jgi:hypothetical protein
MSIAGLDVSTRKSILEILHEVHSHRSPRIVLGNRLQDGIPDWVSHVAFIEPSADSRSSSWVVRTGKADEMKERIARYQAEMSVSSSAAVAQPSIRHDGEVLVELKDVNVSYHERKVSIPGFGLSITGHKFLRYCKTRAGRCVQVRGGTFRDQTVCLKQFHLFTFWVINRVV